MSEERELEKEESSRKMQKYLLQVRTLQKKEKNGFMC